MASPSVTYNAPSFYSDPNYAASQSQLTSDASSLIPYASSLMTGKGLPPTYAGLITPNSPQFQQMLQRTTGNIMGATQDAMASQGIGDSGVAMSAEAGAVGNATSQLTWQDFLNSQSNQMQLMGLGENAMGMGIGATENIGSMALNNQGQNNQFNLTNASESLDSQEFNAQMKMQKEAQQQAFISSLISTAGNVAGMGMMGGMGGGGGMPGMTGSTGGVNAGYMAQPELSSMGPWSLSQGSSSMFAQAPMMMAAA